jgi:hypothetical protein
MHKPMLTPLELAPGKGLRTSLCTPRRLPQCRQASAGTAASSSRPSRARAILQAVVSLCAFLALTAALAAPALAARGHVFEKSFGSKGSGPGQFNEPAGIAINESKGEPQSGDVYVLDTANNRVEYFSAEGVYVGEFTGPSTTGSGTLTEGSAKIESVLTTTGAFTVGEEIEATGLPAGTTITAVPGAGVLELSQPVEVGKSGLAVELKAHQAFSLGPPETEMGGIAVDSNPSSPSLGDVYVLDRGHQIIDKFSSTGAYIGQIAGMPPEGFVNRELLGVAVGANGELWVSETHSKGSIQTSEYGFDNFTNEVATKFVSFRLARGIEHTPCVNTIEDWTTLRTGLAVGATDNIYAATSTRNVNTVGEFNSKGERLSCAVDGENDETISGFATERSTDDVYVNNVSSIARYGPAADGKNPEIERFGQGHLTGGTAVAVNSATNQVYVADAATGVVNIFSLEGPGRATVESESVSNVKTTSATLAAEINPRGASTQYHFEYGRCTSPGTCATSGYEKSLPAPSASVGSEMDFEVYGVSVHPQDLVAGVVYHLRLVAQNTIKGKLEVVEGEERTFTTQTVGGSALPDGRAWEMVSPPEKHGANMVTNGAGEQTLQASRSGDAMAYETTAPIEAQPPGFTNGVAPILARRTPEGWRSQDIQIPHRESPGQSLTGNEYLFFSSDLSRAALQPFGSFEPGLSAEASEQTAYLRSDYPSGNVNEPCTQACYRPLVTGKSGYANVPAGTVFGAETEGRQCSECGPHFQGATSDLSHVALTSTVPLTQATETAPAATNNDLYEWSAGKLQLVSVLPNEEGGTAVAGNLGSRDTNHRTIASAISRDGSRVIWTPNGSLGLYMRDTLRGETIRLDAVQGGSGNGSAEPSFRLASTDGSRVFFTDRQALTVGAGEGDNSNQGDLYECEMVVAAGGLVCRLSDVTPLSSNGESAHVQGVVGSSQDASSVYFVANGVLAKGAVPGTCGPNAHAGATCNLYVRHDGTTSLVAVLSARDAPDWGRQTNELVEISARVSPNGRWLAFMSQQRLTGNDNRDAVSGRPDEQVFLYDGESGRVVCASCDPTGARPVGQEQYRGQVGQTETRFFGTNGAWENGTSFAALVPGWTLNLYQSRYLSDSGRLFFNSLGALVPQDINGTWDVYQYEPPGIGDCARSAPTFSERSGGCVGLISSGTSPQASAFLDASETGGDVFFLTTEKLSPQDLDTSLDVYDAHECTASSPCLPPPAVQRPPCGTEASCKAAPSPQPGIFGSPSSATFSGQGNVGSPPAPTVKPKTAAQIRAEKLTKALKACHTKKNKKKRIACEKTAHNKYGATKSAKKASHNRRPRR